MYCYLENVLIPTDHSAASFPVHGLCRGRFLEVILPSASVDKCRLPGALKREQFQPDWKTGTTFRNTGIHLALDLIYASTAADQKTRLWMLIWDRVRSIDNDDRWPIDVGDRQKRMWQEERIALY